MIASVVSSTKPGFCPFIAKEHTSCSKQKHMQALQTAHACNVARHATSWADALNQRCPQHCIRVVLNIASVTSSTLHQWRPQQCISDVLNIASVASSTVHQGCPQQCISGVLNIASVVSSTVHQWCPQPNLGSLSFIIFETISLPSQQ